MTRLQEPLLDTKALAGALQKSPRYVYAMLAKGFPDARQGCDRRGSKVARPESLSLLCEQGP
jgi:hypothetical protein